MLSPPERITNRLEAAAAELRAEIAELSQLVVDGELDPAGTISHRVPLEGIESAFQRMRDGVGSRSVVILDSALAGAEPDAV